MSDADANAASFAVPGGEDMDPADIEAELSKSTELTPEEWSKATIEIRDVTETKAFGRSVVKTYYNMYVNGEFYRGYRYSEINKMKNAIAKVDPPHVKAAPKYPAKGRVSIGSASPAQIETRRSLFGPWLNHITKSMKIVSSPVWQSFALNTPDYEEIESELATKVSDIEKIGEHEWTETANKKGVKVCTLKQPDSKLHVVKTFVTVQASLENVLTTYNTKTEWSNWQPDMKACKTIELLEGDSELALPVKEVMYANYRVPVLNNRDVCLFGQRYRGTPSNRDEPGVATSLSMSMQHPSCPRVKGIVRGYLNIGLTYFREIDGGKACTVTSVLHMDPRGMIPPSLINTMAAHTVKSIVDMKDYMEKKYNST
mmetsp:Transcript_89653/g.124534  ORF Transcript_89653/g.124534 Transcript_89653/m.124534 type:complete len:371 (+) Transcript_89653:72-1184(+)